MSQNKDPGEITHVSLPLDTQCNDLLEKSAKKHKRDKRPEAAIRLEDHLLRFGESWHESPSVQYSSSSADKDTHVNLPLNARCNEILNKSAKANHRTKREEAAIRLKDHLLHFDESWHEKSSR
ncbi:TraY domain-containing protein [Pseudomonadota bacterium]